MLIIIPVVTIVYFSTTPLYGSLTDKNATLSSTVPLSSQNVLSVNTDKLKYSPGEIIQVFGRFYDIEGKPGTGKVIVEIVATSNPSVPVVRTSVLARNGTFGVGGLNVAQPGNYYVNASVANSTSWAEFSIIDIWYPNTLVPLGAAGIGIAAFLVILAANLQSDILNFILISEVVLTLLVAVLLTDVEWGVNSPIGLILKSQVDISGHVMLNNQGQPVGAQWMLNVGGTQRNNYSDGIHIPAYVFVFGLVGGYLRYLYDTAKYEETRKKLDEQTEREFQDSIRREHISDISPDKPKVRTRIYIFYQLQRLALIFLSPILATAVWLVLSQLGVQGEIQGTQSQTGIFILAAVSFTIGLVTEEAVQFLISNTKKYLAPEETKP
jgi:hypothetical protein